MLPKDHSAWIQVQDKGPRPAGGKASFAVGEEQVRLTLGKGVKDGEVRCGAGNIVGV